MGELMKALADAERQKKVLEIRNQEKILEKEGEMKVSQINNEIKKAAEENDANIKKKIKKSRRQWQTKISILLNMYSFSLPMLLQIIQSFTSLETTVLLEAFSQK